MKIKLTQGKVAIVDVADHATLSKYKWSFHTAGYAYRKNGPRNVYMHRFIMGATVGQEVDHRNRNGLDNRRANLRLCTHAENSRNRAGINVSFDKRKKKWKAQIGIGMKQRWIGYFETKAEASKAYKQAVIKYHGTFACVSS